MFCHLEPPIDPGQTVDLSCGNSRGHWSGARVPRPPGAYPAAEGAQDFLSVFAENVDNFRST